MRRAQAALSVRSGFRPPSSHIFFSSRLLFLLRSKPGIATRLAARTGTTFPTCAFLFLHPRCCFVAYFGELIILFLFFFRQGISLLLRLRRIFSGYWVRQSNMICCMICGGRVACMVPVGGRARLLQGEPQALVHFVLIRVVAELTCLMGSIV